MSTLDENAALASARPPQAASTSATAATPLRNLMPRDAVPSLAVIDSTMRWAARTVDGRCPRSPASPPSQHHSPPRTPSAAVSFREVLPRRRRSHLFVGVRNLL